MTWYKAAILLVVGGCLMGNTAPSDHVLAMTLRPVVENDEVSAIDVVQKVDGVTPQDGKPFSLAAPVTYALVPAVADRIMGLTVQDAKGTVDFTIQDDPKAKGGYPYYRHWRAKRDVSFPVTVQYRASVQPPRDGANGPAFGIRPSGGGISGSGGGFLLIPENGGTTRSDVKWDLSMMAPKSVGVTSFGEGSFSLAGGPERLTEGWFLAGPAQVWRSTGDVKFDAFWLGQPGFDAQKEMAWSARAYAYLAEAYGYIRPVPDYRVFMRVLETPPYGGGTALVQSFMLSMGKGTPSWAGEAGNRGTLFHEMAHQWTGVMDGHPAHVAWFVEGLNTYFTTTLMAKGELESFDEYLSTVNKIAEDYYDNPSRNWPLTKIGEVGFQDNNIRHLPYMRGALYFADLDLKIRKKSRGKRNLMSALRPLFDERQQGTPLTQDRWEAWLTAELGAKAVENFRATQIEGTALVVPDEGAFGPCLKRVAYTGQGALTASYRWERFSGIPENRCFHW